MARRRDHGDLVHDLDHSTRGAQGHSGYPCHALGEARNELTRVDEEEPEEIEKRREEMRKHD